MAMPGMLTAALGDHPEKRPAGTSRILHSHLLLASENSQTHHSVYSEGKTPTLFLFLLLLSPCHIVSENRIFEFNFISYPLLDMFTASVVILCDL